MNDLLKKYLLPDHSTRVKIVRLEQAWQAGLAHQSYPVPVQRLLGELVAASVLLASNLKFDGSLILQLQGDGPVALVVVECTSELNIRATATLRDGHTVPDSGTLQTLLNSQGQGRFIVVLDPNQKTQGFQPYQGVVPLEGDSVAQVLEHYMASSEQLDTRLWLTADAQHAAGMLLQRLPDHGGLHQPQAKPDTQEATTPTAAETWERLLHLSATLKQTELLELDSDTVIHRLFWQEDLLTFDPQPVAWHCPCTRERVAQMLQNLGQSEVDSIVQERGSVEIVCNFCGKPYHFDAVDCTGLFTGATQTGLPPDATVH